MLQVQQAAQQEPSRHSAPPSNPQHHASNRPHTDSPTPGSAEGLPDQQQHSEAEQASSTSRQPPHSQQASWPWPEASRSQAQQPRPGSSSARRRQGAAVTAPEQGQLSEPPAVHHLRRVSISDTVSEAGLGRESESGSGQQTGEASPEPTSLDFTFDSGTAEADGEGDEGAMRCMSASEMVLALCDALNRRQEARGSGNLQHPPSAYVSALIVPRDGAIWVDREQLAELGIVQVHAVDSVLDDHGRCEYVPDSLVAGIDTVLREAQTYDI